MCASGSPASAVARGSVLVGRRGRGSGGGQRGERQKQERQRKTEGPPPLLGQRQLRRGLTCSGCSRGWSPVFPASPLQPPESGPRPRRAFGSAERCPPRPALARGAKRGGRRGCALDRRARGAPWWQVWGAQRPAPPRSWRAASPALRALLPRGPPVARVRAVLRRVLQPRVRSTPPDLVGLLREAGTELPGPGPHQTGPRDAAGVTRARGVSSPGDLIGAEPKRASATLASGAAGRCPHGHPRASPGGRGDSPTRAAFAPRWVCRRTS